MTSTTIPGDNIAEECPTWQTATLILKDEDGKIVGYGFLKRLADGTADLQVGSEPHGVRLLRGEEHP